MTELKDGWQGIINGQVYSADLATVQQWVSEGRVKPTDKVKKGNLNWIRAAYVPALRPVFSSNPSMSESVSSPLGLPGAPPVNMAISQYACQRCGSENTTSLSMAFSAGVSRGSVQAASWNSDFGQTASQTDLSRMCAPPLSPSYWNETAWNFFAGGVLGILAIAVLIGYLVSPEAAVLLFMVGIPLSLIFGSVMRRSSFQVDEQEYNKVYSWWQKTWVCLRCGARYTV
jgi:hypothetical protein